MRRFRFHLHREARELVRVALLHQPRDLRRRAFLNLFQVKTSGLLAEAQLAVHFMLAGVLVVREESFHLRAVPAIKCLEPRGKLLTCRSLGRLNPCPSRLHHIEETAGDVLFPDRILNGSFLPAKLMLMNVLGRPRDSIAASATDAWNQIIC